MVLSFRRVSPDISNTSELFSQKNVLSSSSQQLPTTKEPMKKPTKTTLLLGTSITANIKEEKIGKNGNICRNLSQRGAKINDITANILKFKETNSSMHVDKIIISVGTNDVNNVRSSTAVKGLEEPLHNLISTAKNAYPTAEIYIQSLLPIKLKEWHCEDNLVTVDKVYSFNRLLFNTCKKFNLFYVDIFNLFISKGMPGPHSVRVDLYRDRLHLNWKGLSVLARKLIYIVNKDSFGFHPKRF